MGYIRGYFKWGQIPTALSAFLLLLATLVFGIINMAVFVEHKRTVLAWPPWKTYDPAVDATVPVDANLATAIRFVLLVNCIIVAIAIFYAGAFPLYKYNNTKRYPNKLQDNLASFGWFFLAMHHIGNISMIILLTAGLRAWAGALPVLLILPTLHFILKGLLPEFPPSAHYWLGLCVDITHFPLIGLYAWRASTLDAPFELYGMAAELLHVLSVIPETYATCTRPAQTGSFANPKGYDYEAPAGLVSRPGTLRRGPSHHTAPLTLTSPSYTRGAMSPRQGGPQPPHVQVEMGPVLDLATAASSGNIDVRLQAGAQGSSSHDIQAAIKLDPVITTKTDKASAPEDKPPPLGEAMAALAAPPKEPPVYAMLVLFNVASFFFYGGLIAMQ